MALWSKNSAPPPPHIKSQQGVMPLLCISLLTRLLVDKREKTTFNTQPLLATHPISILFFQTIFQLFHQVKLMACTTKIKDRKKLLQFIQNECRFKSLYLVALMHVCIILNCSTPLIFSSIDITNSNLHIVLCNNLSSVLMAFFCNDTKREET